MMTAVISMLAALGVEHARIRTEDFASSSNATRERAISRLAVGADGGVRRYNLDLGSLGRATGVAVGHSLLDAALAHDVPLRHTCGGAGACGDCRVRIAGAVETEDPNAILSEAERRAGWVLACQTYPTGDVVAVGSPGSA
jgi:ferredoxin